MKYRKRPIVVEAVQWTGTQESLNEILEMGATLLHGPTDDTRLVVTLEGDMLLKVGGYVIKGIKGEFYPCDEDIFVKTYEVVKGIKYRD